MEGPLIGSLSEDARFLQQVVLDVGAADVARHVEVDLDEFALQFQFWKDLFLRLI